MNLFGEIARCAALSLFSLLALGVISTSHAAPPGDDTPPWLPDQHYVAKGCYLSAIAYIAKLQQLYPDAEARTLTVRLPSGLLHTIVAVRWKTCSFLRDMYIGVAPLGEDAQLSFDAAITTWKTQSGQHAYPERQPHSRAERKREVELAAKLISFAKPQIIRVESPNGIVSVLHWQMSDGKLGLYEPLLGTAVGCSSQPPSIVARQLLGATRGTGIVEISAPRKATTG
jgi:hypothetical protein